MGFKKLKEGKARVALPRLLRVIFVLALSLIWLPGCLFHRHRGSDVATPVNPGDQPDKILYQKATAEIRRGRYDVGRLTLQTLINTYPDSEYLSKAKLAIADSYYNEGGVSGLTQAEIEYKDFITFFPTAPEAPEAQYRAGMAHYRLMAKADRDRTEAKLAEAEFKEFLVKYPDNPLMLRVKRRYREVQEILAQGDYKIAKFYYMKGANPAAKLRFEEIVEKYPDFSQGDSALWYLGLSLERIKKPYEAIPYYQRIVAEHPLSSLAPVAKERLIAMHQVVPHPTKAVLARAKADRAVKPNGGMFTKLGGLMSSGPDTSATRHGPVQLGKPKPGEVEVAKAPAGTAPTGATVIAQPVSDASLNSGKAEDPKPAANPNGKASSENPTAQKSSTTANSSENGEPEPSKKKSRFHVFKKLVPF